MAQPLSDDDMFELTSLAYGRWGVEYDALKAVKAERDDGTDDWQDFHTERLRNATAQESKWKALYRRAAATFKFPT